MAWICSLGFTSVLLGSIPGALPIIESANYPTCVFGFLIVAPWLWKVVSVFLINWLFVSMYLSVFSINLAKISSNWDLFSCWYCPETCYDFDIDFLPKRSLDDFATQDCKCQNVGYFADVDPIACIPLAPFHVKELGIQLCCILSHTLHNLAFLLVLHL